MGAADRARANRSRAPAAGGDAWATIALATGYRYLRAEPDGRFPIIFRMAGRDVAAAFAALRARPGWQVPEVYAEDAHLFPRSQAFATARLTRAAYLELIAGRVTSIHSWSLQLPVKPERARPASPSSDPRGDLTEPAPLVPDGSRARAGSRQLFGVIDSGCPFARSDLLDGGRSRIVSLWDQDERPVLSSLPDGDPCKARKPRRTGYGGELVGAQLELWASRFRDDAGLTNERACYRAAGYRLLDAEFQHGAAVLSLLAGPSTVEGRHPARPDSRPQWRTESTRRAARADIIFVQVSADSVQDSSSASLPRSLLDGLRHIVAVARERACKRLVVNLSSSTSRSAHDGGSIIEQAMQALVDDLRDQGIELHLVLAGGNSFDEMRHAEFKVDGSSPSAAVSMHLPAGSEAPGFVTLAIDPGARDLQFGLGRGSHPGPRDWIDVGVDDEGTWRGWPARAPVAWVASAAPRPGERRIVAVQFAPTVSFEAQYPISTPGVWVLALRRKPGSRGRKAVNAGLWISRGQPNPGGLDRARQARFIDTDGQYDPCRPLRRCEDDPVPPRSAIRRRGTLSGMATMAPQAGILVVGSRTARERQPSLYASDGPTADARAGPDCWRVTDCSRSQPGIRVTGVFSGSVIRVEGTSFAAPQVARDVMNTGRRAKPEGPRRRRQCG